MGGGTPERRIKWVFVEEQEFVGEMWVVCWQQKRGMKYMHGVGEEQVICQDLSAGAFWKKTGGGRRWCPCMCGRGWLSVALEMLAGFVF